MDMSTSISRSSTPGSSSSSIGSISSSSSESSDTSTSDAASASTSVSGTFDIGLTRVVQENTHEAGPQYETAPLAQVNSQGGASRPACPQPVRLLIRGVGLLVGGVGLFGMIYGGLGVSMPPELATYPERDKAMALMVIGAALMFIGLGTCLQGGKREMPPAPTANLA